MSEFTKDKAVRDPITVQSIPIGLDWNQISFSLDSGQTGTVTVTNTPASKRLSLWNFLWSVRINTDDDNHTFPTGAELTGDEVDLRLSDWVDFVASSDTSNIRVHRIQFENYSTGTHTYYLYYKAYVFAAVTGSIST